MCGGIGRVEPDDPEGPEVFFVSAGKRYSAHEQITKRLERLRGDVQVCEPYFGSGTLARLQHLASCGSVSVLIRHIERGERTTLPRLVTEFRSEHPHMEFRMHGGPELHDRYILTDDELMLLGHGLKDIGNRESFVVRLGRDMVEDLMADVRSAFNNKWRAASPYP